MQSTILWENKICTTPSMSTISLLHQLKASYVITQYETLVFLLVSDQGEPDSVLRSQLHLVYQLILLLFGPTNLHQRRRALDRFKKTIQKLVDTAFHLLETNQSVLVQVRPITRLSSYIFTYLYNTVYRAARSK